jgi:DUF4097 and DUF4098 domain-containing protein YvlB
MMKKMTLIVIIAALLVALVLADSKYTVQDKELIQKTLKFQDPSKPGELSLDNVFGSIKVEAADIGQVELTAHKTIRAKSKDALQQAKTEVKLDLTEKANAIDIYVDGPFRCQSEGRRGLKWRDVGYEVQYDFVLKVPRRTRLTLKTVNDGDIFVKGVEGDFDINNVNGKVELADMAGSGQARTVNGEVKAAFVKNPVADCAFETINGDVELAFREGLSADLKLKTFNGEAFSDFDTKQLPGEAAASEKKEGKFVYHQDRFTRVRAGKGGPVVSCDTLNGDILIKKYKAS